MSFADAGAALGISARRARRRTDNNYLSLAIGPGVIWGVSRASVEREASLPRWRRRWHGFLDYVSWL